MYMYWPEYFPSSVILVTWFGSLSGITFFILQEFPSSFLLMKVHCWYFCMSENVFTSVFGRYVHCFRILGYYFLFSTLKVLLHCLLAWIVTRKDICCLSFLCSSICNMFFLTRGRDRVFLAGFEYVQYHVPWCSFLHVSCLWSLLSYLDLWFSPVWEFLNSVSHYFSIFFFLFLPLDILFWRSQLNIYPIAWSYPPEAHWSSVNVYSLFCVGFIWNHFYCYVSKFTTWVSIVPNLLLISSNVFFQFWNCGFHL